MPSINPYLSTYCVKQNDGTTAAAAAAAVAPAAAAEATAIARQKIETRVASNAALI